MLSDKDFSHTRHTSPKSSLWLTGVLLLDIDISKSLQLVERAEAAAGNGRRASDQGLAGAGHNAGSDDPVAVIAPRSPGIYPARAGPYHRREYSGR